MKEQSYTELTEMNELLAEWDDNKVTIKKKGDDNTFKKVNHERAQKMKEIRERTMKNREYLGNTDKTHEEIKEQAKRDWNTIPRSKEEILAEANAIHSMPTKLSEIKP